MAQSLVAGTPGARAIVGIDTGGTFTDVTLLDTETGRVFTVKTPSTPDDPSRGFANGLAAVLQVAGLTGRDIARVLHGTTVATNLILERKGARAALLTTTGFKYVIEIGRQDVPRRSSLFAWVKPKRPVAPEHIFEIGGRIGPDGTEIQPLDEAAVLAAAAAIRGEGLATIAVVLLHSYANPVHERRIAEILKAALPEALVSLSSEVLPVFREYERSMTTMLNAVVMPVVSGYVERLDQRIREAGIRAPLLLMKSSGGVTSTTSVRRAPVETALSGPAAGVVGATQVGQTSGERNLIAIDIGGTSADISLIEGAEPGLTTERPHWRLAGRVTNGRYRHDRCRGRLARTSLGDGRAARRSGKCRCGAGAGMLWPWRHPSDGDRRASGARPPAAESAQRALQARHHRCTHGHR